MNTKIKKIQRDRRRKRIRAKVFGTQEKPRLSVFKSNKYITAQIIDDSRGVTLVYATTKNMKEKTTIEKAKSLGQNIAKEAKQKNITKVVFDRGGYIYTGAISALALGAREGGLDF